MSFFRKSFREKMEATSGDKLKDAPYFADIAKLDAGLGRKEEAIREARRAVELQPITKDSLNGPTWVANLALVYAWTGERDLALEQLEKSGDASGIWAHVRRSPLQSVLGFFARRSALRQDHCRSQGCQ